ncbi:protein asteroid homolog 1 isoform X1 [Hemicordylus capensis]|uniref:protein asteroid homolog 1 isoform X1 n=1 Tax=Hemicordylus capensis TaxID=884348 RepID=UPI002303109A|nr:protein asteroid homolog 1 isoform X1 [Hemicordylus capensis]XP_053114941.1 protein asteroid homolog 1 isoform X1 [Hemicordylus capensis]XP_053114942.1 protein asteroid homolog 1 isoform X1 [Hemicordylus capensis]XP_053114943.1 protein asteroid homolog 1 isoform X1 [Hemicordylus capensis]
MGIHGLMSYVGEHNEFFLDLKLRNTKVIIDGNNLYHRLYFDSNLDIRRGGDYDSFTDITHKFFETLTVCSIQAYVVLDGGCDASDKKLTTLKERAQEKIRSAHSLSRGGGGCVLPLLIREVFKQILTQLQVPFVQSFSEADRDIVSFANHLNGLVLTLDSDFCIFDLRAGYCPLNYFQWRNLCTHKDSQDCYIPARCFSLERFCNHFSNMNKTLLPLFAVMSGNDYINLPAMEMFFSKVCLPVGSSRQRGRKHVRIQGLLNWLSRFSDPTEAIENVLKYLPKHEEEQTRHFLCSSMAEYEPSKINVEDFFQNGVYDSEEAKDLELPQWIIVALAKGLLAPFVSDALVLRRTFLHAQVENMQRPSAHSTALPLRQVIYRLLLNISQCSLSTSLNKPPVSSIFHEFDRSQLSLKKSFVQAAALPGNVCNDQYSLVMLNEVALADRLTLLLEALSVTGSILEPIPRLLWLPVAVTCYWAQHSEPKVKLHHMKALLLGFVYGELHSVLHNPDPEIPAAEVNTIVYNQFLNWKQKKLQKEVLDLDTAHVFCQWQCCLQVGLYLNQLLSSPLPEPDLTRLYNGTLVHRLCRELKSTSTPENILSASPKMYQLYCNMVHIVKDSIPPNFFQKKKSKKRKNQALAKKEGATVEALPLCSVNNRFAAFMVED